MAEFKEETLSGSKWQRCNKITIYNQYGQTPYAVFELEDMMNVGGNVVRLQGSETRVNYDPQKVTPIYDPVTFQSTGATFTQEQLYGMLLSSFIDVASGN